jgi:hypothetical protein
MSNFLLAKENLESRDIASDRESISQRIEAFRDVMPVSEPALIISENPANTTPVEACIPEVSIDEFTSEKLRAAIAEHGALIVRNMFSEAEAESLVHIIDGVLDAADMPKKERAKLASSYFNPPGNMVSSMPGGAMELGSLRLFNSAGGGVMAVEAPTVAEVLLEFYEKHNLKKILADYLGEPACLSVKKWVLRRSKLPCNPGGWHQDGAFMGTDINSLNMWIPLTQCGGDTGAPGMDLVPQRLYKIASANGATFDWSVSNEYVCSGSFCAPPVAPVFNAGDAFFFDHLYLHRTQYREDFTKVRYALETWFFGASTFPKDQVPIAW